MKGKVEETKENRCPGCRRITMDKNGFLVCYDYPKIFCSVCNFYHSVKCEFCGHYDLILSADYWKCTCGGKYVKRINLESKNV